MAQGVVAKGEDLTCARLAEIRAALAHSGLLPKPAVDGAAAASGWRSGRIRQINRLTPQPDD
jgi:hypothetical protein